MHPTLGVARPAPAPSRIGRLARGAAIGGLLAVLMLVVAGRADRPWLDACAALIAVAALAASAVIDPELTRERLRAGQRGEDDVRLGAIRLLVLATYIVALLDVGRFGWSPAMGWPLQAGALLVVAASLAFALWAISVNRFFVPVIRLQPDRGQHVIDAGPYARVRHPGYAGVAALMPASAIALGSWWALVPALVVATLFVARASHEDRFLADRLDGYAAYRARVRWRLLPGVW